MKAPALVFLDCETTRIKPGPATIWELAVIRRGDGWCGETWLWQIRPDLADADPAALRIGGYYERCGVQGAALGEVRVMPVDGDGGEAVYSGSRELARSLVHMLDGAVIVGANPQFDVGHLDAFLRANGECLTADYHLTDIGSLVLGWAHGKHAGYLGVIDVVRESHRQQDCGGIGTGEPYPRPRIAPPLKLADAARIAGIDPDSYDAHTALGDARLVRDIYDAVTGGGAS